MKKTVDAMGDACLIPVVKTKKVIEELKAQGGTVETFVDNEIAVQNLTKLGKSSGYSVLSEKLEEKKFRVEIQVTAGEAAQMQEQEPSCIPDMINAGTRSGNFLPVYGRGRSGAWNSTDEKLYLRTFSAGSASLYHTVL